MYLFTYLVLSINTMIVLIFLQEPQSSGVQRSLATISIPLNAVSTMSVCLEDLYWSPAQEV